MKKTKTDLQQELIKEKKKTENVFELARKFIANLCETEGFIKPQTLEEKKESLFSEISALIGKEK